MQPLRVFVVFVTRSVRQDKAQEHFVFICTQTDLELGILVN
jgi:hypothetical protein